MRSGLSSAAFDRASEAELKRLEQATLPRWLDMTAEQWKQEMDTQLQAVGPLVMSVWQEAWFSAYTYHQNFMRMPERQRWLTNPPISRDENSLVALNFRNKLMKIMSKDAVSRAVRKSRSSLSELLVSMFKSHGCGTEHELTDLEKNVRSPTPPGGDPSKAIEAYDDWLLDLQRLQSMGFPVPHENVIFHCIITLLGTVQLPRLTKLRLDSMMIDLGLDRALKPRDSVLEYGTSLHSAVLEEMARRDGIRLKSARNAAAAAAGVPKGKAGTFAKAVSHPPAAKAAAAPSAAAAAAPSPKAIAASSAKTIKKVLVCYNMVNFGKCDRKDCSFSHDPQLILEMKKKKKVTFGTAAAASGSSSAAAASGVGSSSSPFPRQ
jgi:hypothetical protein